jgi:hypothetical protein
LSVLRNATLGLLLLLLLLMLSGCQFAQSGFAKTAGDAGGAFAAASTTLSYAHAGKITFAYARSGFVNYQNELDGLDQELATQSGAPDQHTVQQLLTLYRSAMRVIDQPCLDTGCDWHAQVLLLNKASGAFLKAQAEAGGQ